MGIVIRQSAKSAVANLLGVGLGAFNILWLFPAVLSPREIGVINTLESASIIGSLVAGLGGNVIADKFFPRYKNPEAKHEGYLGFLLMYAFCFWWVFGAIFYLGYEIYWGFYAQKSPEMRPFFHLIFPFAGLLSLQLSLESLARIHLRIAIPAFLREFFLRLLIVASVLLYAGGYLTFGQLVEARLWAYAMVCLLLLGYLGKLGIPFWYVRWSFFSRANVLPILRFGFSIFFGAIGTGLIMKIDVLMLGSLRNQAEVGIFTIAFFMGNVLEIPRKTMAQISQPILAQAWQEQNTALIQKMYGQSSRNALLVGGWFFLGIWLNIDGLFSYIPHSEVYQAGKAVVWWVAITRLLDMGMGLNSEIITQSRFYLFNFVSVAGLLVFVVGFNLWLIPLYGIGGAAISSFLSILGLNIVKYLFLYVKFGFQPFSPKHLAILAIMGLCYQAIWIPVFLPTWADIMLRSAVITGAYWGLNLACQTSEELHNIWQKWAGKLRGKFSS